MGLVICFSCGRQRKVKFAKGMSQPTVCGNCGAHGPRLIHKLTSRMKLKGFTEDAIDGIDLHEARARTLAGLKWYGEQKGYTPGWASVKFKSIYGSWPNGESGVPPDNPQQGLLDWVKRDFAPFKKMMREKEAAAKRVTPEPTSELMSAEDTVFSWR